MKPTNHQPLLALFALSTVVVSPLLLSGCAQFNQLMGTPAEPAETAQPAPAQEPAPQTTVTAPPAEPASSQSTGTAGHGTKPASKAAIAPKHKAGQEQSSHAASHAPSHSTQPATIAQPSEPDTKAASDKAVAEKEQSPKSKKASAASDKKSTKKSSKPATKPQPEDALLPPVPLPSKPAAIGGSGG